MENAKKKHEKECTLMWTEMEIGPKNVWMNWGNEKNGVNSDMIENRN